MALYRTGLYVKNHAVEQVQVASTPIASFNGNVTGLYIPELIAYITAKQSGSGTPSPDNIRPISGVNECNVVRCGKNLFDKTTATFDSGSYDADGNVISNPSLKHISNYLIVKGDTDYTLSGTIYVSSVAIRVFYFDANKNWIGRSNAYTSNSVSFTTPANCCYIQFQCSSSISSLDDWQIEFGSTATAYEAYNGNTYTIQLGDTYYGGSLDVTTGELTVDKKGKYVDSELSISYDSTNQRFFVTLPDMADNTSARNKVILCSTYDNKVNVPYVASWDNVIYNSGNDRPKDIAIHDRRYTTVSDFVAYASQNCFIVYPLATPITVQLTPTQVEQLLANNVFADTGDVEGKFYNVIR